MKILSRLAIVVALAAAAVPAQAATFGIYGDTFNNGTSFDLSSNTSPFTYSGMFWDPAGSPTLGSITQLSADYNYLAGAFGGGSPRFGIADLLGNQAWGYWGTPLGGGSFSNPNANGIWANTGNYADSSSTDVRWYSNCFGLLCMPNTGLTWLQLTSLVGNVPYGYVVLDLDHGWSGSDQHMLVDNFRLNNYNVAAVPGPIVGAGLPGLVVALGGLVVLARRRRNLA